MKPNTRIDNFLAKIAGDPDANTAMQPRSPEEYYLNQIAENGGGGGGSTGGGVLVVGMDMQTFTLDKTWQEIYDAPLAIIGGKDEIGGVSGMSGFVQQTLESGHHIWIILFIISNGTVTLQPLYFAASSADDYPVIDM